MDGLGASEVRTDGAPAEVMSPARAPRRRSTSQRSRCVWMVASEALPFAKSGGLGDVMAALPDALARCGLEVTVVLPRYRGVSCDDAPLAGLPVSLGHARSIIRFFHLRRASGVRLVLVDEPALYDREGLYGDRRGDYPDNARRFALLVRAALALAAHERAEVDVFHGHDWQAGLLPVYAREASRAAGSRRPALVHTVHNLAYQGLFGPEWIGALEIPPELYTVDGLEYWHRISFLKAALTLSDVVNTVSPGYAKDVVRPGRGFGLDGVLAARGDRFVGILNGIDVEIWNPAADPLIPAPYDARTLGGKTVAKRALLSTFGVPVNETTLARPLVAMISRMVEQKGHGLIRASAPDLFALDASVIVVGDGDPLYEQMWRAVAAALPGRVAVRVGFDETLSHLVYAGADIFMMPSRFEPCGLSQMYSMRYGTVPVVHATGGLDDTVVAVDARGGQGTGFKFTRYEPAAFVSALREALALYRHPDRWRAVQRRGMARDFSWAAAAGEYRQLYERAMRLSRLPGRSGNPGVFG